MTVDIKQRLKALPYANIKIKSLHRQISSLKSGVLRGQTFDSMPKSKSNKNQSEEFNIRVIDKSDELFKEIEKIYKEQDELIRAIESIENPFENIVMRLLYIDGLSWNEVQIQLRCSRSTIKRARESALKSLSKNGTNRTK